MERYCPDASVIECFDQYGRADWGEAHEFGFLRGTLNDNGADVIVYNVNWTGVGYSTWFELRIIQENWQYRIDTRQVNEEEPFPPE